MNQLLLMMLQCGEFLLTPIATFAIGLWLIVRLVVMDNRLSQVLIAVLIGITFFAPSTVGMLIDPRGGWARFPEIIRISVIVGLITTLSVLVFGPVLRAIMNIFK